MNSIARMAPNRTFRNRSFSQHRDNAEPDWTKVYINHLDAWFDCEERVFQLLEEYGKITDIKLVIKNGAPIGVAYVTFADHRGAINACQALDGVRNRRGEMINVQRAHTPTERLERAQKFETVGIWRVLVKNLNDRIDDRHLFNTFSRFGTILSYMVIRNDLGYSLCYGFVAFLTKEAAHRAIDRGNGLNLYGDRVQVEWINSINDYHPQPVYGRKIFVKGIPDEKTLRKKFKVYGCIQDIDMNGNKSNLTFVDKLSALRALADISVSTHRCEVKMASPEPKDERDTKFKPVYRFKCISCHNVTHINMQIGFGCEHQFCWQCLKKTVEFYMLKGMADNIKCPNNDCKQTADQRIVAILTSRELFEKNVEKDSDDQDQIVNAFDLMKI